MTRFQAPTGTRPGALGRSVTKRIPLMRRDGTVRAWALVDASDYTALAKYRWHLGGRPRYAKRHTGDGLCLYMHREILGISHLNFRTDQVDHINGDPLDNRRCNLRVVTMAENQLNRHHGRRSRSGYRGVREVSPGRFEGTVKRLGTRHHLGTHDSAEEAYIAVCRKLTEMGVPGYEVAKSEAVAA